MPKSPSSADNNQQYNEVELPASVEIRESLVLAGQPGAFCKTFIKKDTRFGPYKGEIIIPGHKAEIDYRYAWEVFEKRRNVLKYTISALDPKTGNWMRNVNCARFYEEQNIVSTQEGFSIFYIAMKDIKPGEELLTWFDPQLLKRTRRRTSRGERRKVGYTIELVPWSDEKKFVPEIIETKRARKKKVLGEDMLCFEEDAALMQKSLNSMFRVPRKLEPHMQPARVNYQPQHALKTPYVSEPKKVLHKSSPVSTFQRAQFDNKISVHTASVLTSPAKPEIKQNVLPHMLNGKGDKKETFLSEPSYKTWQDKREKEALRKRMYRERVKSNMTNSVKNYIENHVTETKKVLDSTIGFNPNDPNLLKPVVMRMRDNGIAEMEDHDETYTISSTLVRQECDDLCQCMDKRELLSQEHNTSAFIHKGKDEFVVHFTLLPEHQTFTMNNKVIYKCDICDSSYNHAFSLKRHYLGVHINHRYLSKNDIKHCQLETFHNGANGDEFQVSVKRENDEIPTPQNQISTSSSVKADDANVGIHANDSSKNEHGPKDSCTVSEDDAKSLLCEETLLDSSTDEGKKDIPSLSSLAQSQVEKNKSLLVSSTCSKTKNSDLRDTSLECHEHLSGEIIEKSDSSPCSSQNSCTMGPSDNCKVANTEEENKNQNDEEGKTLEKIPEQRKDTKDEKVIEDKTVCEISEESGEKERKVKQVTECDSEKGEYVDLSQQILKNKDAEKGLECTDVKQNVELDSRQDEQFMEIELENGKSSSNEHKQKLVEEPIVNESIDLLGNEEGHCEKDKANSEIVNQTTCKSDVNNCAENRDAVDQTGVLSISAENRGSVNQTEGKTDVVSDSSENGETANQSGGKTDVSNSTEKKEAVNQTECKTDIVSNSRENKEAVNQTECETDVSNSTENKEAVNHTECKTDVSISEENREAVKQTECKTDVSTSTEKSEGGTFSSPTLLPIPPNIVQATTGIIGPQPQQQFLLLVPIMSPTNKQPPSTSIPMNPSTLPQSQSGLPLVVISQVQSNTTNVQLQSSVINPNICPQILSRPNQSFSMLSAPSSAPVQNFAFIPHNSNNAPISSLHSITTAKTSSPTGISAVTTKSSDQSISLTVPCSSGSDIVINAIKVEEAEQPCDLYRCHMCVLVYKTMSELKHHIRNDPHRFKGGLKQYACPKCSVRFRNKANLARHNLMHHQTGDDKDRKFKCLTCGKGFTTETYLKMHARFHLGKSFPCKYGCVDTYFPNAGSLVKHLRAVHPGLNLKEYLREKAQKERMKKLSTSNSGMEYSIDRPGIGFQAKRGRPKGSKNIPKEFKLLSANSKALSMSSSVENSIPVPVEMLEADPYSIRESHAPNRNYLRFERYKQTGNTFLNRERNLSAENAQESISVVRRRFHCNLCDASFLSYFYLLKHRSKRHGAAESVQEFLFDMRKDTDEPICSDANTFQFSPPPSPKSFFSNVNQRGAENMSKYIEGGEEMLKCRKKFSFDFYEKDSHTLSSQLEWPHYNFPPCFKYVQDCTMFYHGTGEKRASDEKNNEVNILKSEPYEISQESIEHTVDSTIENSDIVTEVKKEVKISEGVTDANNLISEDSHGPGNNTEDVNMVCNDVNKNISDIQTDGVLTTVELNEAKKNESSESNSSGAEKIEENVEKLSEASNGSASVSTFDKVGSSLWNTNGDYSSGSVKEKDVNDSKGLSTLDDRPKSMVHAHPGIKKSPKKEKVRSHDVMNWLNSFSVKALDLEVGSKYEKHCSPHVLSVADSLNLFLNETNKSCNRLFGGRKRRETFSATSAYSQLLSKRLCRSRDLFGGSWFSPFDQSRHEPRRYSIWQGPNYSKIDTKTSDKFCCPVVESVRLQNVIKKRKEISEKNEKEEIELKPKQKKKEDFASNIGLMSRWNYEHSHHGLEKTEHCIKPPEIWEIYDRIWFGKKGAITVVCSVCHRHFSCLELCLRHQLKKHPHIEPSSLEMERGNYVEDMYYYYPMPYGILAQTHLIPEKMPSPEVYVCTRCRFPFKNINKLHSHMVLCDPNNNVTVLKTASVNFDNKQPTMMNQEIDKNLTASESIHNKPSRQRVLTSKFLNYQMIGKLPLKNTRDRTNKFSSSKNISQSPVSAYVSKSQNFLNFSSSLPRRKKNQHGLLYNPSNHMRRRELYHVLDQHQCHGCNLKFKSMSMLERHVKNCSGKDKLQNQKPLLSGVADEMLKRKQHTCRYCNKRFTFIKGVDLHYKRICSIRKIREEENQLTKEDLAHEAELEKIIEHLKWSKSLNKDSSDIIQGRVKVEEDGTLTRVDKKRGRPFGTGKRVKRKGFRWTTLKHHRPDDDNFVPSSGQNSPRILDTDQCGLSSSNDEKRFIESLDKAVTNTVSETSVDDIEKNKKKSTEKVEEKKNTVSQSDSLKLLPRKRGRPFKNRDNSTPHPVKPKGKRGRPRKDTKMKHPEAEFAFEAQSLKDNIKFKRGEVTQQKLSAFGKAQPVYPNFSNEKTCDTKATKLCYGGEKLNGFQSKKDSNSKIDNSKTNKESSKFRKSTVPATAMKKRKIDEDIPVAEVSKPPPRVRGRPKKFDPSDMESSYKKKKKTDPDYIPFVRNVNRDGPKVEANTGDDKEEINKKVPTVNRKPDNISVLSSRRASNGDGELSEYSEQCEQQSTESIHEKESDKSDGQSEDTKLKSDTESADKKQIQIESNKIMLGKSPDSTKAGKNINKDKLKLNNSQEEKCEEMSKCVPLDVTSKTSEDPNTEKQKSIVILKKRKNEMSSPVDSESKRQKYVENEPEDNELPKTKLVQSKPHCEGSDKKYPKSLSFDKAEAKVITVTTSQTHSMTTSQPLTQTPVALRIVTLPVSAAQQLSSLGGMKIIKSPLTSSPLPTKILSPSSSSTPASSLTTTVVSSPVVKFMCSQTPQQNLTSKTPFVSHETNTTTLTTTTTVSNTAAPKTPLGQVQNIISPNDSKSVIQPSAFPMAQVIPIENGNLILPPQAVQTGLNPRYIIHSSPRRPSVPTIPGPTPVSGTTRPTTPVRHTSPSTVILSTGKVVSMPGTFITGGNVIQNSAIPQGKKMMKIGNVVYPVDNASSVPLPQPVVSNPPRPVIRMSKTIATTAPSPSLLGVSTSPRSLYYVQTSPLSSQAVISSIKTGDKEAQGMTAGNKQVLVSLGDAKAKIMDTIAMPQLQFIPVTSLVQGTSQNQQENCQNDTSVQNISEQSSIQKNGNSPRQESDDKSQSKN